MFNSLKNSPKDVVKAMKETDKLVKKLLKKRQKLDRIRNCAIIYI